MRCDFEAWKLMLIIALVVWQECLPDSIYNASLRDVQGCLTLIHNPVSALAEVEVSIREQHEPQKPVAISIGGCKC